MKTTAQQVRSQQALAHCRIFEMLHGQTIDQAYRSPHALRATPPRGHHITDRHERKVKARWMARVRFHNGVDADDFDIAFEPPLQGEKHTQVWTEEMANAELQASKTRVKSVKAGPAFDKAVLKTVAKKSAAQPKVRKAAARGR